MSTCTECNTPVWHYYHSPEHIAKGTYGAHLFSVGEMTVVHPEPGVSRYTVGRFLLDVVIVGVALVAIVMVGNFLGAVSDFLVAVVK